MMQILSLMLALAVDAYPVSYTSCGVGHVVNAGPTRVVTMNQGATEFLLALGLADKMVGTAYLDDYIWPQYAAEYAKIPVLSSGYPNETTIMSVSPDFIVASYNSAFRQVTDGKGIFSDATVGPCTGNGAEWDDAKTTCRPQLHAAGIGTYLFADACEDTSLRPPLVTEATVYSELRALGSIFNVDAEPIIDDMKNDFSAAASMVSTAMHGEKMTAVWLDCVGRCCPDSQVFVGAGSGAPNMLMREAGLDNVFENVDGNWACVNESDVIAASPDVIVVVDAAWDTALGKMKWLYDHEGFCGMDALEGGRFVQIPFSATTLGPRNGPAALDLAIAALHVRLGALTAVRESGVSSFNPRQIESDTAGLKCSLVKEKVLYDDETTSTTTTTTTTSAGSSDVSGGHSQINRALWPGAFAWLLACLSF